MMWPDTRLCTLFEIDHPIIQAPMMGTCTPELASAVANAGGLGSLGCGEKSLDTIRAEVATLRDRTNRAFNLNFFVYDTPETPPQTLAAARERLAPWHDRLGLAPPPDTLPALGPGFDADRLSILLDLKPKVASFHFGIPGAEAIAALKAAGITLIGTATNVAEARHLEAAGMDAIIAQGWEAGGHRGSHRPTAPHDGIGTMALVPQVVDAVRVPVIAAGGIADGRGIAAALALGASGVQMGTAFLRAPEAATEPQRRDRIAKARDTDTIVTDAISGRSARAMRSRFTEEMERSRQPLPAFPQMYALSGPLRQAAPDDEVSFFLYGQAASLTRDLPAAALMDRLVTEAQDVLRNLGQPQPTPAR